MSFLLANRTVSDESISINRSFDVSIDQSGPNKTKTEGKVANQTVILVVLDKFERFN